MCTHILSLMVHVSVIVGNENICGLNISLDPCVIISPSSSLYFPNPPPSLSGLNVHYSLAKVYLRSPEPRSSCGIFAYTCTSLWDIQLYH